MANLSFIILSFTVALLPFILFIAAMLLIRRTGDPETAARRQLLFLSWTGIVLAALITLASWQTLSPYLGGYATILAPVAAGTIALAALHRSAWRDLHPMQRSLLGVALMLLAAFVAARFLLGQLAEDMRLIDLSYTVLTVLIVSAGLILAWTVGRRSPAALGLIALAYLAAVNLLEFGAVSFFAGEHTTGLQTAAYLGIPGVAVAAMAFLAAGGQSAPPAPNEPDNGDTLPPGADQVPRPGSEQARRRILGRLGFALLILAVLIYTYVWLWIWDGIDDGIRGYFMLIVSGQAAAAAALVMALTGPVRRIWAGPVFLAVIIAAVYGGMLWIGTRFSPYEITEARAVRIGAAVEAYRADKGAYPAALADLVPGAFWRVPRPMIFADQGWCYESGPDFYRLGAVYRETWSSPIIEVRVYSSAGNVPVSEWVCDERREDAEARHGMVFNPPTPVPRPTGVVPVERTLVQPILRGTSFSTGGWSPDGAYLVFGLTEYYGELGERMEIDLHFLSAATGEICRAARPLWQAGPGSNGLRDHFAWLPDGRGLYVSDTGEMVALTPCSDTVEDLAGRYPAAFDRIFSADPASGRILLGDAETFWLLDGATLAAEPVAGLVLSPSAEFTLSGAEGLGVNSVEGFDLAPADVHWADYDWSPDGNRLAVSVLADPETGAIHIIDAAAGAVEQVLPVEGASDAALPIAEWLSGDELLLHGAGFTILDLRTVPPGRTDLLRDVFLLDVDAMQTISSLDFLPNLSGEGYVIGVRIDHPRNAGVYLYSSAAGEVQVFEHDTESMFFFPGGRWLRFRQWEDDPTYSSDFEWVRFDQPDESLRLTVPGHAPRAYPDVFTGYLPGSGQLIFYSSQGISLVSLDGGETLAFWDLEGAGDFFTVFASPGEEALVVVADGVGVYFIALPGGNN